MRTFDFYEFTGIFVPGTLLIVAALLLYPNEFAFLTNEGVNVGGFGVIIVVAYAVGHLLQAVGNLIEKVWWSYAGMPTDWVRTNKCALIADVQKLELRAHILQKLGIDIMISEQSYKEWRSITRQMYAFVENHNEECRQLRKQRERQIPAVLRLRKPGHHG